MLSALRLHRSGSRTADAAVAARLAALAARGWVPGSDLGLEGVAEVDAQERAEGSDQPGQRQWKGSMASTAARLWQDLPDDAAPDPAGPPDLARELPGRHARAVLSRSALLSRFGDLRLDPGRRSAVAVVLVAAIAVLVTVVLVWRGRPAPEAVGAVPSPASIAAAVPGSAVPGSAVPGSAVPGSSVPSPFSPAASGNEVVVAVAGKVRRPGLVHLPAGSRVADAIDAAGGLRPGADLGLLNLARVLSDGEQVLVGIAGAPAAAGPGSVPAGSAAAPAAPVNLNTATAEQLDTLPGVGLVTAQKIIDYRTAHGPFRSVESLQDIPGIGPARYAEIAPGVTL